MLAQHQQQQAGGTGSMSNEETRCLTGLVAKTKALFESSLLQAQTTTTTTPAATCLTPRRLLANTAATRRQWQQQPQSAQQPQAPASSQPLNWLTSPRVSSSSLLAKTSLSSLTSGVGAGVTPLLISQAKPFASSTSNHRIASSVCSSTSSQPSSTSSSSENLNVNSNNINNNNHELTVPSVRQARLCFESSSSSSSSPSKQQSKSVVSSSCTSFQQAYPAPSAHFLNSALLNSVAADVINCPTTTTTTPRSSSEHHQSTNQTTPTSSSGSPGGDIKSGSVMQMIQLFSSRSSSRSANASAASATPTAGASVATTPVKKWDTPKTSYQSANALKSLLNNNNSNETKPQHQSQIVQEVQRSSFSSRRSGGGDSSQPSSVYSSTSSSTSSSSSAATSNSLYTYKVGAKFGDIAVSSVVPSVSTGGAYRKLDDIVKEAELQQQSTTTTTSIVVKSILRKSTSSTPSSASSSSSPTPVTSPLSEALTAPTTTTTEITQDRVDGVPAEKIDSSPCVLPSKLKHREATTTTTTTTTASYAINSYTSSSSSSNVTKQYSPIRPSTTMTRPTPAVTVATSNRFKAGGFVKNMITNANGGNSDAAATQPTTKRFVSFFQGSLLRLKYSL